MGSGCGPLLSRASPLLLRLGQRLRSSLVLHRCCCDPGSGCAPLFSPASSLLRLGQRLRPSFLSCLLTAAAATLGAAALLFSLVPAHLCCCDSGTGCAPLFSCLLTSAAVTRAAAALLFSLVPVLLYCCDSGNGCGPLFSRACSPLLLRLGQRLLSSFLLCLLTSAAATRPSQQFGCGINTRMFY